MALALDANGAAKVFILGRRSASLKTVASKAVRPHTSNVHQPTKPLEKRLPSPHRLRRNIQRLAPSSRRNRLLPSPILKRRDRQRRVWRPHGRPHRQFHRNAKHP